MNEESQVRGYYNITLLLTVKSCREDDGAITVQLLRPVLLVLHGSPAQVASTVSVSLGFSLGEYLHLYRA